MTTVTGKKVILKNLQNEYLIPYTEGGGGSGNPDGQTITFNSSNELQTVAVKDNQSGSPIKTWTGTKEQYEAIAEKDPYTLYNITDDVSTIITDIEELSTEVKGKANITLDNLSDKGHAKLQYAPFSINNGRVTSTGENGTLHLPETQYMKYNVTEVGTLTKNRGVISGFSTSNYAYSSSSKFNPSSTDTWEVVFSVTTGADITTNQYITTSGQSSNPHYYGYLLRIADSKVYVCIGGGESSGNYYEKPSGTISTNTHYLVKLTCNGSGTYSLYLKSDNDNDFVYQNGVSGITMAYSDTYNYPPLIGALYIIASTSGNNKYFAPWLGSIDLEQSYIKINGEYFWQGVVEGTENDYDYIKQSQAYIDVPFEQPTLTANGTLGGDSFAVAASSEYSTFYAYKAFDGDIRAAYGWQSVSSTEAWLEFYNPDALKVTNLRIKNGPQYFVYSGEIQGSNDNNTWTQITTYTNSNTSASGEWDIDLSSNTNYYNYYRIVTRPSSSAYYMHISECTITAVYREQVSSSSTLICDPCTITTCDGRTKEFTQPSVYTISSTPVIVEKDWTQPTLTANGTLGGSSFACAGNNYGSYYAWHAFNKNSSDYWDSMAPNELTFYNPVPLKVTNLQIQNWAGTTHQQLKTGTIYGSNDNETWTKLCDYTNSIFTAGAVWNIDLSSNTQFYNYYKIKSISNSYYSDGRYSCIANINITAVYQETQTDADGTYKVFKNINTGNLSLYDNFKISKTVPLNGSIIGTLTNNNGVLSGFSSGNLFELPSSLSSAVSSGQSWELVICYTVSSSSRGNIFIDGVTNSSATVNGIAIVKDSGSDVVSFILTKTAGSIVQEISHPVTPGIKTWTKVVFDGSKYVTSYSTDGHSFTQAGTYTSSVTISSDTSHTYLGCNIFNNGYYNPFTNGEIDIKECYINVNGSLWWSGAYVAYLNTSTTPAKLYIEGQRNDNLVYMGDVTINTGAITDITNVEYNMLRAELLKQPLSGISFPSQKYIQLTVPSSGGRVTAPANGWLWISGTSSAAGARINLQNNIRRYGIAHATSTIIDVDIPVTKGYETIVTYANVTASTLHMYFFYAEGELHQ